MFKSYRIGTLHGIPIKLDITFLIILPIFAWIIAFQIEELIGILNMAMGTSIPIEPMTEGYMPWILGLTAAIGLFACVLLHELGHSVVAIRYGFPIDSITLWLLGGVAQLTEQPTNWRQELAIAIAGPAVSIGIGVGLWLSVFIIPASWEATIFIVAYLALMNIVLAAFNMLPGFPMDGGRVLRALLARNQPFAVATAQAARVGKLFAIALGLFGLLAMSFLLIAVALFIYIAATGEARYTAIRSAVEGITIRDVMTPREQLDVVSPKISIQELLELMYELRHTGFPVVNEHGVQGIVTLEDVQDVDPNQRSSVRVADVMTTDLTTVSVENDAIDAVEAMQRADIGRLIVLDDENVMAGLITRTDLMRALSIGAIREVEAHPETVPAEGPDLDQVAAATDQPRW